MLAEDVAQESGGSFDVAVIGAGVAGMYATYCCSLMGINCVIIDELRVPGGQCVAIYPEKKLYGVPGYDDVKATDYIDKLSQQCLRKDTIELFGHKVTSLNAKAHGAFEICISDCESEIQNIRARYLIIATGIGEMRPNIPNNIRGINEMMNNSDFVQSYCLNHSLYRDKNVIIAGGGDSAVDFAIDIAQITKSVTVVHRRANFTCESHKIAKLQKLVETGKIKLKMQQNIRELKEFDGKRYVCTDENEYVADHIVFCYGFVASPSSIARDLGIEMEKNLIKVNIENMETSVKNCYAVGDAVTYINKKKNIVPCFFEADRVVRAIKDKISGG